MLKVELHSHTADDPHDRIPHSAEQLIDRAAALGYDALAITLHDRQLDLARLAPYAAERRVVLIPGIERTIARKHVLLLNFPREAELVSSFADLAALKQRVPRGLVVAPHPYFPAPSCLWGLLDDHADLFDAVEVNAMFTEAVDFNAPARRWAQAREQGACRQRRHPSPVAAWHHLFAGGCRAEPQRHLRRHQGRPRPGGGLAALVADRGPDDGGSGSCRAVLPRAHSPQPKAAYP